MKKEDIEFRKNCQLYYNKIESLLKKGKLKEAEKVIYDIRDSLQAWEEHMKSARFRINMLKSLFVNVTLKNKKFIKRAERKINGGNDDQ